MPITYNRVIFAGYLTRDPELRSTQKGTPVGNTALAVNSDRKDGPTLFLEVTAWDKTADLMHKYLRKGDPCLIEGRLEQEEWKDKNTGEQRKKIVLVAQSVKFLRSKQDNDTDTAPPPPRGTKRPAGKVRDSGPETDYATDMGGDDDRPF